MLRRPTLQSAIIIITFLSSAALGDTTFFDGEFSPSDWTVTTQGSGTSTNMQMENGGNPDEFLSITNRPTPVIGETVSGYHFQTSFVYDPSLLGAVDSIEWSYDYTNITNAQFVGLAFEQGGILFAADGFVRSGSFGFWTTTGSWFLAADDLPAGLDLTATGPPITFGIFSANSYDPAFGDNDNIMGFDNLSITVMSAVLLGDVNLDGVVDFLDIQPFVDLLNSGDYQVEADVNQDGVVDFLDIQPFVDLLAGG